MARRALLAHSTAESAAEAAFASAETLGATSAAKGRHTSDAIGSDWITDAADGEGNQCGIQPGWHLRRRRRLEGRPTLGCNYSTSPHSTSRPHEILKVRTGIDADSDGTLRKLTPDQLDAIRQQIGGDDPLQRFVTERWRRRADTHDQRTTAAAESAGHWSVAVFHLRKILKAAPVNPVIQSRLTFGIAKDLVLWRAYKEAKALTKFGAAPPPKRRPQFQKRRQMANSRL